ncbi:MAG: peptidylprolyl isomerase [Bacteroidetes bacterium]|nr:peptidylprolyl isomerase [Bacteroidota bacterium]
MSSIIQDIRDKYAKVTVVLIALALIGFILTDYFQSQSRSGGGSTSNSVGSVNGHNIRYEDYLQNLELNKNNMRSQGYPQSAQMDQQAGEQAWGQSIAKVLLEDELAKLGITVTKKEMGDYLYGSNPPDDIKNQFIDSASGKYDGIKAKKTIDEMLKNKQTSPEQKAQFNNYVSSLEENRKQDKYVSLLANSVNYPRWYAEKQNADQSLMSRVSYVNEAYTSIPDSTIKIEDKEIVEYISKFKDIYKQQESRGITYVSFSANPSASDSVVAKDALLNLKAEFDTTDNVQQFLLNQGVTTYYGGYVNGKTIQIAAKDSIFRTPVGSIYGPYIDGSTYALARMEGVRQMADSVKVRHILISTQNGRDSASAFALADSIKKAIAGGANFDTLCAKYSDDGGSKDKGGVYENFPSGQMVPPFNDFAFMQPVGSKAVVKTEFGYHYMEVLSQKGSGPGYKVAYLFKPIEASKETDNTASENANKFAADVKDLKSFDAVYEKEWKAKGYQKATASNISPTASDITGLGSSRSFVKEIYAAKKGEVLKPTNVETSYVVAIVTEVEKEGLMSASRARMYVEPTLRNKKKAQMLKQKIGKVTTLEAAAAALGGKPITVADSVRMTGASSKLGYEPKVIGASFNTANKGKVVGEALEGVNGVYVVRVDDVTTTPVANGDINLQRKGQTDQKKQSAMNPQTQFYPLNILRGSATIKDKRADHM